MVWIKKWVFFLGPKFRISALISVFAMGFVNAPFLALSKTVDSAPSDWFFNYGHFCKKNNGRRAKKGWLNFWEEVWKVVWFLRESMEAGWTFERKYGRWLDFWKAVWKVGGLLRGSMEGVVGLWEEVWKLVGLLRGRMEASWTFERICVVVSSGGGGPCSLPKPQSLPAGSFDRDRWCSLILKIPTSTTSSEKCMNSISN